MKKNFHIRLRKIFLTLSILFLSIVGFAQRNITGKVIDRDSHLPVAFVNISIIGTYSGTITNNDGDFSITIPSGFSKKKIGFSCIGFQSDTIVPSEIKPELIIKLKKITAEIPEIIVMPENTLRKLFQSAWDKIPENYPVTPTCYNGFYRETLKDETGKYLSFGEAFIMSIRGATTVKNDHGQLKILKSRGGYLPGRDSTTAIHFYGGAFMATSDFVQSRADFINPSKFDNYHYSVSKVDNYYKINFRENKQEESGYFLLDTLSLAYAEAAYTLERNEIDLFYKRIQTQYYCKFIKLDEQYFLKYQNKKGEGFDKIKKKKLIHFDEYLATEISPNCNKKIPDDEQMGYYDVFIDKTEDYSSNYWDDYNIIEPDSALQQGQLTRERINSILGQTRQKSKREKLVAFFSRFSLKYGLASSVSRIKPATYDFQLSAIDQHFVKELSNAINWSINTTLVYFYSPHCGVMVSDESNIGDRNVYRNTVVGLEYKKQLNSFGRPIWLSLKGGLGRAIAMLKTGTFNNDATIQWGMKELKSNSIAAYVGERSWIVKPTIGFSCFIKARSSLFIDFSYCIPFSSEEMIVLKEKSGLFRKTAVETIPEVGKSIYRDGQSIDRTAMKLPVFTVSLGINFLR